MYSIINLGQNIGTTGAVTYIIDVHRKNAAECFALINFIKDIILYGFARFANSWVQNMVGISILCWVKGKLTSLSSGSFEDLWNPCRGLSSLYFDHSTYGEQFWLERRNRVSNTTHAVHLWKTGAKFCGSTSTVSDSYSDYCLKPFPWHIPCGLESSSYETCFIFRTNMIDRLLSYCRLNLNGSDDDECYEPLLRVYTSQSAPQIASFPWSQSPAVLPRGIRGNPFFQMTPISMLTSLLTSLKFECSSGVRKRYANRSPTNTPLYLWDQEIRGKSISVIEILKKSPTYTFITGDTLDNNLIWGNMLVSTHIDSFLTDVLPLREVNWSSSSTVHRLWSIWPRLI